MKKIQYYGAICYNDEWNILNPEATTFKMDDDKEPFEFFKEVVLKHVSDLPYLITYNEIKE